MKINAYMRATGLSKGAAYFPIMNSFWYRWVFFYDMNKQASTFKPKSFKGKIWPADAFETKNPGVKVSQIKWISSLQGYVIEVFQANLGGCLFSIRISVISLLSVSEGLYLPKPFSAQAKAGKPLTHMVIASEVSWRH